MDDLAALLRIISGGNPKALIEVRYAVPVGFGQQWFHAGYEGLPRFIVTTGKHSDAYVGAAPRTRREGGRDAVRAVNALWVDCDTEEAVERLRAFRHAPTMTVASGSPGRLHAWWALDAPLPSAWALVANRRLCHHLAADPKCAEVARILRPPGTRNHKHDPPASVVAESVTDRRYAVADLVADLDDPNGHKPTASKRRDISPALMGGDELATISPLDYVPRLTGREPNGRGFIACPFHAGGKERTPSFKVYDTPERGWTCFGCQKGGRIYDLGALLYDLPTRGDGFKELRERLEREFS